MLNVTVHSVQRHYIPLYMAIDVLKIIRIFHTSDKEQQTDIKTNKTVFSLPFMIFGDLVGFVVVYSSKWEK